MLGHFHLGEWWLSTFTQDEREYIERVFKPMSIGGDQGTRPLTHGHIGSTTETAVGLLGALSGWFNTPKDYPIARRILTKAGELVSQEKKILNVHFFYQSMIQVHYRNRDIDPIALDLAIQACETQISLAPAAAKQFRKEYPKQPLPAHVGYTQLTIIRDKQGQLEEAIRLAKQAEEQGWNGDWGKRILRYEAKRAKVTQKSAR